MPGPDIGGLPGGGGLPESQRRPFLPGHRWGGAVQVPALRARRQQAQLHCRVRLLLPGHGPADGQGPAARPVRGHPGLQPAGHLLAHRAVLPRAGAARSSSSTTTTCARSCSNPASRAARDCPTGACARWNAAPTGRRTTSSPPTRPTAISRSAAAARRPGTSRSCAPARTRTSSSAGPRTRSCAGAARTWPRTSASWARRTAWTSWSGRPTSWSASSAATTSRFTLIGSGDCFDELVALRDELGLGGHVEFTGRAPDELVTRIMSTADVGLSPDPKNPLNDVSTMNKSMEYMAFELPVVAFDLRETRVSVADAGVYVRPNDVHEYAKAIVDADGRRGQARRAGQARPGTGRAGAGLEPSGARLPRRLRQPHGRRQGARAGADVCGIAGCYQQADGQQARRRHERPDRPPRPGRRRRRGATRTTGSAVHLGHRRLSIIDLSAAADQPMIKDGLALVYNGELYNYKELRARAGRPRRPVSSPAPTPRWCSRPGAPGGPPRCAGSAACSRSRWPTTQTGELFLARDPLGIKPLFYLPAGRRRAVRLGAQGAGRRGRARAAHRAGRAGGVDALLLGARAVLRDRRRAQAAARLVGPAAPGWPPPGGAVLERRRRGRATRPPARRADLGRVIEESVTAHLVADVPVSSFLSGGLDSSIITVLAHRAARRSTPTRSPSGPRTSGWRPCPTTRSTPVRSRRGTASSCTRSRSRRTSSTCCPAWWTRWTSRSATRRPSTRC